ncbi:MAG: HAMP domain-containing sensor histidine kinase [Bacteroidia bacterium]
MVVGVEVISTQKRLSLSLEELNHDLERKVAQRTRSLREVNEELRGFAHNVSHDLRTPLVNITGFVQELNWGLHELKKSLLGQPLSPKTEKLLHEELPEALHYIEQAGIQMDRLLESLRRLSSMGQFNLELTEVDVTEVWKRVCDSQAHSILEKGIKVESASLPVIKTDYLALSQILTNLLSNSIKYADDERKAIIRFWGEKDEKQVLLYLRDNGIGIPESKLEFIFHPFTRLNGKDLAEGEGMGLAFVKTLVRKLNGEISCARNEDHGVTFRLALPK